MNSMEGLAVGILWRIICSENTNERKLIHEIAFVVSKKTSVKDNNVESAMKNSSPMKSELSGDNRADKQNESKGEQSAMALNLPGP